MEFWELFRGCINARTPKDGVGGWRLLGRIVCGLSIVMLKKETRRKKLDLRISISLSPLYFFLAYLVIGDETGVGEWYKGGKKKSPTK